MSIIAYFIPYLFLFASQIRLQNRPLPSDTIRVPGSRPVATALAIIGFLSTGLTIVLSVIPGEDEPHKLLAVAKVLISTAVLIGIGVAIFVRADRTRRRGPTTKPKTYLIAGNQRPPNLIQCLLSVHKRPASGGEVSDGGRPCSTISAR